MPGKRQAFAQFPVVVEFPVENHRHVARFIPHGLVAGLQVDDAETPHAQRQARSARFVDEKSVIVRSAMPHRRSHRPHLRLRLGGAPGKRDSADPAHALLDLRRAKERRSGSYDLGAQLKARNLQPVIGVPPQNNPQQ